MLKSRVLIALLFFCVISMFAQKSINEYKYVIVPIQFDFQKGEDEHQLNSLTKFLFNKAGFEAYLSTDKLPEELKVNRCLSLTAMLKNNSKMLSTRMNFELIDCSNNIVFVTSESRSKTKDYKKAYHECVRGSFEDIEALNYKYEDSSVNSLVNATIVVNDVNTKSEDKLELSVSSDHVEENTPASSSVPIEEVSVVTATVSNTNDKVLYAQTVENGYQLVDSTPKVVYTLLKTNVKNVYLIKDSSGIVYKQNESWKVDFYVNGALETKPLDIKFF